MGEWDMNFQEHVKYTKSLEDRISVLEFVLRDAGLIKIDTSGVKVPRVTRFYISDGKLLPMYQMDETGMVKYF
jgi:hypothetical protein